MGETCWLCGDLLVCWCGKINIEVGCFIVGTCVAPWSVMVGLGRLFAATVSTMPGHWRATGCASGSATGGAMSGSA